MTDRVAGDDWSWLPEGTPAPDAVALTAARRQTATLLDDRGVTYGTDAPGGRSRDWRLDPVPVVIDEAEWSALERAIAQRAALLDAIIADLYGPRTLLADGVIPPEVVLAHPAFLRAVDRLTTPGPHGLVLTATDLSRDPSGAWRAVADRTQAPSGAGYAMVDRRVIAQSMARVYRQTSIRRIGPFFHALRRALDAAAPAGVRRPQAVLLTAGPWSETAFDQAYLASMLGIPLVEGSDLEVREGRVWLQGLEGSEQVDVILRRVDSEWCDPLDLRADSRLGVPGLVRAVRAGTVAVVNPLGSGVLEHPALGAYLPRAARVVLGEDLALASPETWWCGDAAARSHALAHLDELVLKHTTAAQERAVLGWTLDTASRESLAAQILADPLHWTAQERVDDATSGADGGRPAVLRTFAVGQDEGYQVMAGGLALVAPSRQRVVSSSLGAIAKDVWVIAAEAEASHDPWLLTAADEPLPRQLVAVSPRTAENLFWLGRYAERSGDVVRLLRATVDRWYDHARRPASPGGRALGVLLESLDAREPASWARSGATPATTGRAAGQDGTPEQESTQRHLRSLLLDPDAPGTVAWSVRRMSEAAAAARDQMSNDMWLPLASMERALEEEAALERAPGSTTGLLPVLDRLLEALLAVAGIESEGMVRDIGWHLQDAGRRVERSLYVVESLSATMVTAQPENVDAYLLESVLIAHESSITYRRRHSARPDPAHVLDLLLSDTSNPRSLAFQVDRLREDLAKVPSRLSTDARDRLVADIAEIVAELDVRSAAAVLDGRRERLAELLESVRWRLRSVADEIAVAHFVHPTTSRALADSWGLT
ncbi:circularly permuted type 2 ATP-grasp protein [Actinotalea sp.]|uniref:circularly permuted type 2 ATP-grasp protein n=1 Tax=Actinotalea sp. TaxID=1872145 RepID=UPI0035633510